MDSKLTLLLIVLAVVIIFTACTPKKQTDMIDTVITKESAVSKISPDEAKKMMETENPPLLADVREPSEYAAGHIPHAVNLPLGNVVKEIDALNLAKDAPIIVYCRSGRRSADAAIALAKAGYEKIYDLGGIMNWKYEVVQ